MPVRNIAQFSAATAINDLQYVDPNLTAVTNEVIAVLKACLPPVVAQMNSDFNLKIPTPNIKAIRKAPALLDDEYINSILVGANISTESQAPRQFLNFTDLTIYWVRERIKTESQVNETHECGAAIRAVMYQFVTGYADANDRRVWGELTPQPYAWLPEEWGDYSGIAVPFRARHDPGHNLWKPLP